MVLKQDRATGKVVAYRPGILWFVRESEAFPYTADKKIKIQWLEKDVCAVTYTLPEDGNIHQYVMTYGDWDKGDISPPMYSRLDGVWGPKDQNTAGWYLRTDEDGVHLRWECLKEKDLTFSKYRSSLAKETKYDLMKKLRFFPKNAKLNTT